MSEWTPAGVSTKSENRSGAGVDFFKEMPEPEWSWSHFLNIRLVCLFFIIIIAGCFFYIACYNVKFKCEKLLHRKSKNFNTTWMQKGKVGEFHVCKDLDNFLFMMIR